MATTADLEFMQQGAARAAALLRAVGNEHRLLMLCLLIEQGEASVGTLLEQVRLSQSALSQHLAVLREEGLVQTRREAQNVFYALMPGPAAQVMHTLHGIYCAPAAAPAPRQRTRRS